MIRVRNWLAVTAVMLVLSVLAACGTAENKQEVPAAQTENSGQTSTNAEKSEKPADDKQDVAETRVVKDEFGEVTIPAHPKRVVALYLEDYLKALEITPVAQWYHPTWGMQDYLQIDAPPFDTSGSLEALLAFNPDLIIVDGGADKAKYDQYSKIAPTYRIPEAMLQNSESILTTMADVLNMPEKGKHVIEEYHAKVEDAKTKIKATIGNETVAVIRINTGDKTIALFGAKNRFVGEIYNKLGFELHPLVKNMEEFQQILSEEAFALLDADHIIVLPANGSWDTPENQEAFKLLDSPLWKAVPAFVNGNVYKVERSHWQTGAITANFLKLDDLLKIMVEKSK